MYIHQNPSSVSHLWIKAKEGLTLLVHEMSKETGPSQSHGIQYPKEVRI